MPVLHVARWDKFGYLGMELDRGQIVEMKGAPNDEKLLRLGYISQVSERNPRILECGECGAKFLEDSARDAHVRRRHPHRRHRSNMPEMAAAGVIDPQTGEPTAYIDVDGDKEERRRAEETPLYLDKTAASRK